MLHIILIDHHSQYTHLQPSRTFFKFSALTTRSPITSSLKTLSSFSLRTSPSSLRSLNKCSQRPLYSRSNKLTATSTSLNEPLLFLNPRQASKNCSQLIFLSFEPGPKASQMVPVFTMMPSERITFVKDSQLRVYSAVAKRKKDYFIFLNSVWLIFEWNFQGNQSGAFRGLVQVRVRFSWPVGYFLLYDDISGSNNQIQMITAHYTIINQAYNNSNPTLSQIMLTHILLLSSLLLVSLCQVPPFWWIPINGFEVATVSLIVNGYLPSSPKYTSITFTKQFSNLPQILLSLSTLKQSSSSIRLYQQSPTRSPTAFTHKLTLANPSLSVQTLKICYCALDLAKFTFVYPHSSVIPCMISIISQSGNTNLMAEFVLVQYLGALNAGTVYEIVAVLAGFQVVSTTSYYIGVEAELYSDTQFLLKTKTRNGKLLNIQILRILIDKTLESQQTTVLHLLSSIAGTVQHIPNAPSVYSPTKNVFYSTGTFYGVMQFQARFQCQYNLSINVPAVPARNIKIGFVLFKEFICYSGAVYEQTTSTCYPKTAPRLYQINLEYYGFCHQACYSCNGPNFTNCQSYLPSQATNTSTSITCKPEYASSPITGHCLPCSSFVVGCNRCLANGSCTGCIAGCLFVNDTWCNCTGLCASELEFVSPHTGACQCVPQYYRMANGSCGVCADGCYTCKGSAVTCESCIDGYELQGASCLNFVKSNFLLDSSIGLASSRDRCTQYSDTMCLSYCASTSYMYSKACYPYECPTSNFPYLEHYSSSRMCQACAASCYDCDNYYTCKKCIDGNYYLNATGYCVGCGEGCAVCGVGGLCGGCVGGWVMDNGTCVEVLPAVPTSCATGCAECVIDGYCQVCSTGYYRYRDNPQCSPCTGPGLLPSQPILLDGLITLQCLQTCGDGLLYMDECDDGNTQAGDGCSSRCTVEAGYTCEYVGAWNRSLCLLDGVAMGCSFRKNLTGNQVNITVTWVGGSIKFGYTCQADMQVIAQYLHTNSSTYTVSYPTAGQSKTCTFTLPTSHPPLTCQITTSPQSTSTLSLTTSPILHYLTLALSYTAQPIAYSMWVLCILGIDPYDILVHHMFVYLYVAGLYDYEYQPVNVYGGFGLFKQFGFFWGAGDDGEDLATDGLCFVDPCKRILIFYAIVVVYHQLIVRFLKNKKLFHRYQTNLFSNIFSNRFMVYISTCLTTLPITLLYSLSIYKLASPSPLPLALASLLVLCLAACSILLIIIAPALTQVKSRVKYLYFVIIFMEAIFLTSFNTVNGTDRLFVGVWVWLVTLALCWVYALMDGGGEFVDLLAADEGYGERYYGNYGRNVKQVRRRNSQEESSQQLNQLSQQQSQQQDPDQLLLELKKLQPINSTKQWLRKTALSLHILSFSTISLLRFLYFHPGLKLTPSSYQTIGIVIVTLFITCNLFAGFVVNLVSQAVTVVYYARVRVEGLGGRGGEGSEGGVGLAVGEG